MKVLLLATLALAQNRANLFTKPQPKEEKKAELRRPAQVEPIVVGNLPYEYRARAYYAIEGSPTVSPQGKNNLKLKDILIGDILEAEIKESVIAFPDSKAPVRAIVTSGPLKNTILIGEATLEKNSKRILIEFKKLRTSNVDDNWLVQASVLDEKGILGIEGKLVSNEGKYFAGEMLAAGAAGYADATVKREQTSQGTYIEVPSLDTISKKAMSAALSRTADRFAEKVRNAPEYAYLEGPIAIQILIIDQPKQE